ncbi:MAG: hypothetical protein ACJARI_003698 [Bacteroidia bacterium]|jgi:hypothetical protein
MTSGGGRLAEIGDVYMYSSPYFINFDDLTWRYRLYVFIA